MGLSREYAPHITVGTQKKQEHEANLVLLVRIKASDIFIIL